MRRLRSIVGLSEDRVDAVEAIHRRTARARHTLVACRKDGIHKVIAAGALHQVSSRRGHVPQLRTGSRKQRKREQWIVLHNQPMVREIGVSYRRANRHAARIARHLVQPDVRNIDECRRRLNAILHQVDEVRSAAKKLRSMRTDTM
jgi:hypothetical protein